MSLLSAYWIGLSLAAAQVETPKTVNGEELGSVEEFQDRGAKRICLATASIDLEPDETATLQYAGIHHATVRVTARSGYFDIIYGDTWAPMKEQKVGVLSEDLRQIYRIGRGKSRIYAFQLEDTGTGTDTDTDTDTEPYVSFPLRISGPRLAGNDRDLAVLRRVSLYSDDPPGCDRQYRFGWAMLFGDEPLSTGKE